MRDFFRGWRRMMGVMTLVTASIFAAGWVRSLVISDEVWFPVPWRHQVVYLGNGGMLWSGTPRSANIYVEWKYRSAPAATHKIESVALRNLIILDPRSAAGYRVWRVRYWMIVIPLTLLSAYMLFRNPRSMKPTGPKEAQVMHA